MGADLSRRRAISFPRPSSTTGRREYDKGDKDVQPGLVRRQRAADPRCGPRGLHGRAKEVAGCLAPEPVPGHAPGMLSFRLRSRGEEGLFTADMMHNAIQIVRPDWNDRYCLWPDKALKSRARGAQARGRARRADHADASRRALLRLCAPPGRGLRVRAGDMSEPVAQQPQGAARARRGRLLDDGAAHAQHRDRAGSPRPPVSTRSISISSIRACRSRPRARSASRRWHAASRRSCACRSSS